MSSRQRPTLEQWLEEFHEQLWQQLHSGLSWSDAEDVLLDTLARSIHLLEQHVSIPQSNTPWETVRSRLIDSYIWLATLLGRNTPDAVIADAIQQIREISSQLEYPTSRGRHAKITPEDWIDRHIKPRLDIDQQDYICDVRIFSGWKRLYDVWNNRLSKLRKKLKDS